MNNRLNIYIFLKCLYFLSVIVIFFSHCVRSNHNNILMYQNFKIVSIMHFVSQILLTLKYFVNIILSILINVYLLSF